MPAEVINEVRLFKCGTNQVKVWIDDYKAFFEILDTCRGNGNSFFTLNKQDWEVLKKFLDNNLRDSFFVDITPEKDELIKW